MSCGCKHNGSGGIGLAASYESRAFTIAAGASVFIDANVRLVAVLNLAGADDFQIRLNDGQAGLAFESWQFRALDGDGVRKVELINPNGGPIEVTLALARSGELVDGRFALPGALDVALVSPSLLGTGLDATIAATTTTAVLGSDANRREVMIQNLDPTNAVRVGESSVGAARGLRLAPGDVLTLTTTATIYVHNPNASGVSVALLHVRAA